MTRKAARHRVFLLSPANSAGERTRLLLRPEPRFELARAVQSPEGAPIGDVFAFASGLYFRGKLAYARTFARPPRGTSGEWVITPGRGLLSVDTLIRADDLRAFARIPVDAGDVRYRAPLERDARLLARRLGPRGEVVLLGSVASKKYTDVLLDVFGDRLLFPIDFVGRGDMSRGGLMLRASRSHVELPYAKVAGASVRGSRPPRLPRPPSAGPIGRIRRRAIELGAKPAPVKAGDVEPMLASPCREPFFREGWLFEVKYDGFRLRAAKEQGRPRLFYRRGSDVTERFPELALAVHALPGADLLLDGELVAPGADGRPDFDRLQARASGGNRAPVCLYAFDLLSFDGLDLRPLPLVERKRLLRMLLPKAGPVRYVEHVEDGCALFEEVARRGLEGIVAKRAGSPYRSGRSDAWRKICVTRSGTFHVVGYSSDALHLADRQLRYAGRVELGVPVRALEQARAMISALVRPSPACSGPVPRRGVTWLEPRLRCVVHFKQRTERGSLRDGVLAGFLP